MTSELLTTNTFVSSPLTAKGKFNYNPSADYSLSAGKATTQILFAKPQLDLIVQEYFCSAPDKRKDLREDTAARVNSLTKVLEVLDWSTNTRVRDAYDAAVDLLAKCSTVTLAVAQYRILKESRLDKQWATLISGIGRAHHIPRLDRLQAITQQFNSQQRVVKEAVIDALFLLADEAKEAQDTHILSVVMAYLQWLASDSQTDKYIQRYAKDVLIELS